MSIALLDQHIPKDAYESAIISFCAVRSLQAEQSFLTAVQFTPILSALIKCAQFFIYAAAKRQAGDGDPTGPLRQLCKENILIDKSKPFPLLYSWRLYGMGIGRSQVPVPSITWNSEANTVTYSAERLRLDDLRVGLCQAIENINNQLHQDILFSISTPIIDLESIVDSLPNDKPGYWFVRDPRNDLYSKWRWLLQQVHSNAMLRERFLVKVNRDFT